MDQELLDFYAGLAMVGLLSAGNNPDYLRDLTDTAFEVAEAMMEKRNTIKEKQVNG